MIKFHTQPRTRNKYWVCSKFADLIRGQKKPIALTLEDWDKWKTDQKKNNKIRYYISDILLGKIQNFLYTPIDIYSAIKRYIKNKYFIKTHYLKTGLEPGYFYEFDERILYGLFNELKDYVEIDLAKSYANGNKKKFKKRSSEYGLQYLSWASKLKYKGRPTKQARDAIKIEKLYNWWKERPNRKEPHELSDWMSVEKDLSEIKIKSKKKAAFKKSQDIQESYDKEDQSMLIELIKIRSSLWV